MSMRSGTKGLILCFIIALMLTFHGGAAFATDNSSNINRSGDGVHGLVASDAVDLLWRNLGTITINGNDAFGMYADVPNSTIENALSSLRTGTIVTKGDGSHGMVATEETEAFNMGRLGLSLSLKSPYISISPKRASITTEGDGSHGMVADGSGSVIWNAGNILTKGSGSFGLLAEGGGVAHNYSQTYEEADFNLGLV